MRVLEFWPDYHAGPLWDEDGRSVNLSQLAQFGLGSGLAQKLAAWNRQFDEAKLPIGGHEPGDLAWLSEGVMLLTQARYALSPSHLIVTHEPWWTL